MNKGNLEKIFTCRNCVWGEQCADADDLICEYFDSLDGSEDEIESVAFNKLRYIEFTAEWELYCGETKGAV